MGLEKRVVYLIFWAFKFFFCFLIDNNCSCLWQKADYFDACIHIVMTKSTYLLYPSPQILVISLWCEHSKSCLLILKHRIVNSGCPTVQQNNRFYIHCNFGTILTNLLPPFTSGLWCYSFPSTVVRSIFLGSKSE